MSEDTKKIFIVDSSSLVRKALETQIVMRGGKSLEVRAFESLSEVAENLDKNVKGIFIDLLRFPLDESINFVGTVRNAYPWIVFVLWVVNEEFEQALPRMPEEWKRRFGHYFKIAKNTGSANFMSDVITALDLVDADYRWYMNNPNIRVAFETENVLETGYSHTAVAIESAPLNQRAFISYARADSEFADWLWQQLRVQAIETWMDRKDIHPGQVWDDEIHQALLHCVAMILVLTPQSVASKNVAKEWKFFLETGRPIIPLLLQDCTPHFQLVNLQYIDFRKYRPNALNELVSSLKGILEI